MKYKHSFKMKNELKTCKNSLVHCTEKESGASFSPKIRKSLDCILLRDAHFQPSNPKEMGQNTELRWVSKPIHIDFTLATRLVTNLVKSKIQQVLTNIA